MKLFILAILFTTFTISAMAQVNLDASVYSTTNAPQGTQDIGVGLGGGFRYQRAFVGLDVFSDPSRNNPKFPTRGRAFMTYDLIDYSGVKFSFGGGGWKTGNETGGFGQVGVSYDRLKVWGRYGNQDFIEADGAFEAIKTDRFAVAPFYRFTRLDVQQPVHQAGLRFTLR